MSLKSYVTLGRSGLRISPFCLGAMTFGEDWGWGSSVAESNAILARFIELGGNFIDTANVYTKGHSEKIIGDFISHDRSRRDRMVIATKFAGNMYGHAGDPNGGGASAKSMVQACEQSLRRLRTDYIDLYWMHFWDPLTPIEETMRALDDLVAAGKVRYIAFSDTPAWKVTQAQMLAQFRGWAPLIALQLEYSLLERSIEGDLVPMAQEFGLGVIPWSPLKGGLLSGKYTRAKSNTADPGRSDQAAATLGEKEYTLIDKLIEIGSQHNATVAAVALAWVQSRPGVASTLFGARTLKQLEDNVAALEINLSAENISQLDALSEPAKTQASRLLAGTQSFIQDGLTVNGVTAHKSPLAPKSAADIY